MSSFDKIYSTSGRGRLYESITQTVGDTPVVKLNRIAPEHVNMYECFFVPLEPYPYPIFVDRSA